MRQAIFIICLITVLSAGAQDIVQKNYTTKKANSSNITVDGQFDETEWQNAHWENEFIQHEPVQGLPPYQQTRYAIFYDENNIYVAIHALDNNSDSISYRLTRRDEADGDKVGVAFDTYFDRRTAFFFVVSAAGVKADWIMSNDGENEDMTWDPIWWVKTAKVADGWNAEMRIPLTQLRFEKNDEQNWGLQVFRVVFRKEEVSVWNPMKREESGFVSKFGTMNGFGNVEPRKTVDIMPYVVARTERFEKEPENPFRSTGKRSNIDAGLDAKLGLTNNLILDLTINPDFGQVEADPSEVNLTTFETFFQEKRPFFIEGKNILSFKLMFGDGELAANNLFYSRRIGRRPHYSPDLEDNQYARIPEFTRILGAAKITGKTSNGWSIGILESITAEENAQIRGIGNGYSQTVEPLTNYFVSRLQKDFNQGSTYLGGMFTAVNRSLDDEHLEFLHRSAYTGGIDFVHKWNNNNWMIDGNLYFSQVAGTTEAITNTQESYIRTFQRPDADYLDYDTTRTSLFGHGGKFTFGKQGGNLKFMAGAAWKSPGLEVNDIGYEQQVDNIFQILWIGYRFYKPFLFFRNASLNFNQWVQMDFNGEVTSPGGNLNAYAQLKNYWSVSSSYNLNGPMLSHSALRGGPSLVTPGYQNFHFRFYTNQQKKLTFYYSNSFYRSNEKGYRSSNNYSAGLGYRPTKSLQAELSPGFYTEKSTLQYVDQADYANGKRYIFATIDRITWNMSIRVNYNITPDLTIQYWGQPFIATGDYSSFKYITNSRADKTENRYNIYTPGQISYDPEEESYLIDDNMNGSTDYSFDKPDFNVKEFLSNLVVRWEYRPGSTLYLVWSQTRSEFQNQGSFNLPANIDKLFNESAHNVFLVKLSYRIGR